MGFILLVLLVVGPVFTLSVKDGRKNLVLQPLSLPTVGTVVFQKVLVSLGVYLLLELQFATGLFFLEGVMRGVCTCGSFSGGGRAIPLPLDTTSFLEHLAAGPR